MDILNISQIIGVIAIFLLFALNFNIGVDIKYYRKSGRVAILWTSIFVFFLFVLRLLNLLGIGTMNDLRIISGFSTLIPLFSIVTHLFLINKIKEHSHEL